MASYNITNKDIEEYTGVQLTDMMNAGIPMDQRQWEEFVNNYVEIIAQIVHKFCNVPTFDPTQPEALITEYRSGKKPTDDWDYPNQYLPRDYRYYLRELYYSGTINGVTYPPVVVMEDEASKANAPSWVLRYARGAIAHAEVDTLTVLTGCVVTGTLTIIVNGTTVTVNVTAGWTIAQVVAAIIAHSPVTDGRGVVWTIAGTSPNVTFTAGSTGPTAMITVNANSTQVQFYVVQTVAGSTLSGGDYEAVTTRDMTLVSFYNNVPAQGENNVMLQYYTGYDPTSKPYRAIRFEILRVFKNLILSKKSVQSVFTLFASGVKDYGNVNQYSEAQLLSHMEMSTLLRYRRIIMPGPWLD